MQLSRRTWLSTSVVRKPLVFDHTETQSGRPGVLGSQSHGLVFFTVGFFGSETAAPAQDHSLSLRRATRVRALKGGNRDYAIGWKRRSESPSLSHRKLVPMGFAGPSVPIQKPINSHRNNVWMGSRGAATMAERARGSAVRRFAIAPLLSRAACATSSALRSTVHCRSDRARVALLPFTTRRCSVRCHHSAGILTGEAPTGTTARRLPNFCSLTRSALLGKGV